MTEPKTSTDAQQENDATGGQAAAAVAEADHAHHGHDHGHDHDHEHEHHHHGAEEFEFVEAPEFQIDYKGECAYEVAVSVPPSNAEKKAGEVLEQLEGEVDIPGFRRGKAPRRLLERKFGKHVRTEVIEKLVGASFRKLIADHDLKPIAYPDIADPESLKNAAEGEALTFTLTFEVAPRCELGTYRGLEVERPVLQIEAKDVDEAVDSLRERYAVYETVDGAKAEAGDQVIMDFAGTIDGEAFAGGSAENYPYILGSGRFFEEFETALAGASAGDELSADVTFPEKYGDLGNKTANFKIKVHEIKRRALPQVDDDFAQQAGYENVAEMRSKIEADLQEGASAQSQRIAESRALRKIVEDSTFELPKSLVESSAREYQQQEVRRLMNMRTSAAEIEEQLEKIKKDAHEHAVREIKSFVVVNEIGEAEGIEVTDEDFEQEAESIRARTGAEAAVIQRFLQQASQRSEYEGRIFRRKALEVVMSNAKVTDVPVSRETMDKEEAESDDA